MSEGAFTPRLPESPPSAVVFDMDGLMLDSERVDREIWRAVLGRRSLQLPDAVHNQLIGRSQTESDRLLSVHYGPTFDAAVARAETREAWAEYITTQGLPHKLGLGELMDFLDSVNIPMAVATSTERTKALLCLGTLAHRFQVMVFGNDVAHAKPAPDLYTLAASRLGIDAGRCLALEDSPTGLAAAEAAGMVAVVIPDLIAPSKRPKFICRTLRDITYWLKGAYATNLHQ